MEESKIRKILWDDQLQRIKHHMTLRLLVVPQAAKLHLKEPFIRNISPPGEG
jgi:hypothetical protein